MTIRVEYTDHDGEILFATSLYDSMEAAAWTNMEFNPSGNELIGLEKMLATTLMQFILDQLSRLEFETERAVDAEHPHPRLEVARAAFEDARSHLLIASMLAVKGIVSHEMGLAAVNARQEAAGLDDSSWVDAADELLEAARKAAGLDPPPAADC